MSTQKLNEKVLDNILKKMVNVAEKSKNEVFDISEQSRLEFERIKKELFETRQLVKETIAKSEELEVKTKHARNRLTEVSKHFNQFTEKQVKDAYDTALNLHTELTLNRQKEEQLRERRDELERRLRNMEKMVDRAEGLIGQISVVLGYLTGDLKEVNNVLEDARQKQEFGLRIIEAQEDERKRLSRDIHDGPAQMLANVMMRSDLIEKISRERGMEEALKEIRDMREMVRSALYEVRKIIYDLRPMALDDLGLIPTLKRYLTTMEEYYNIPIRLVHFGKEKRISANLEVALFRLIQEGVQNACRHADATDIQVKVEFGDKDGYIIITDNGKGFEMKEKRQNKFGLLGMRERVDLLKGELQIDSQVNKGTRITIRVPILKKD